jgi:hypothetical protein
MTNENKPEIHILKNVQVFLKRIDGVDVFFPLIITASTLCKIIDNDTLTKKQLKIARDGGFDVSVKMDDYNLDE